MPDPSYNSKAILGEQLQKVMEDVAAEIDKVKQAEDGSSTGTGFEVLFSGTGDSTTRTESARKSSKMTFQPSTGKFKATKLETAADQYEDDGSAFGLHLHNSNIRGLQSIYMDGISYHSHEGFHFPRTGGNFDSLWVKDGAILFDPNRVQGETNHGVADCQKVARLPTSITDSKAVLTDGTEGKAKLADWFDPSRVSTSSDTSSWSSDNTNVPTRAAVESKISSAMSGSLGGFLGPKSPNDISLYQISGHTFLKGDWFVVSESGTAYYYPNNDRSASSVALNMLEGEEYYWTTGGTLVKKPSTSLQIYSIDSLSEWNELNSTGLYLVNSQASGVAHSPFSGKCVCYVSVANGNTIQMALNGSKLLIRYKPSGTPWTSWKDMSVADVAKDYDPSGGIAAEFSRKQDNLFFTTTGGGSASNPAADKSYVDSVTGSWMYTVGTSYIKHSNSGVFIGSGSIASAYCLSQVVYEAGFTRRIEVSADFSLITSDNRFALFPPYAYCGLNGTTEIRRKWKQYIRYVITLNNTGNDSGTIYAYCGGRATTTEAGYIRRGSIMVDGLTVSTPGTSPTEWDIGSFNKTSLGGVPAHASRTWEVWWYGTADTEGQPFSGHDYMFITTIK